MTSPSTQHAARLFLIGSVVALTAPLAPGQTLTTLHRFTGGNDGGDPNDGLVSSGSTLFGTTQAGGNFGHGTVFALNFDGTSFVTIYHFIGGPDGANPGAGLVLSGDTLYGTTTAGGASGNGTVFAVHTDGTGFTNLHSFSALTNATNSDGANPRAGLILSGDTLFGTAEFGGNSGGGTVFAVHTDGTGFSNLHSFGALSATNSDGAYPFTGLTLFNNVLQGNTYQGGNSGNGTVFALQPDGTGFTNLHTFAPGIGSWPTVVNSDGANPSGGFIVSGNTFFGGTFTGGSKGAGTLFRMRIDGTEFTDLHDFTAMAYSGSSYTNQEGASPVNSLRLAGDTLYGVAYFAGLSGGGTVFSMTTNGADFKVLHSLDGASEGAEPLGGLVISGTTLFGTTSIGGSGNAPEGGLVGSGTVFSLTLLPQLTITPIGSNVVIKWPSTAGGLDYSGFTLQTATNLSAPVWTTNLSGPDLVNGQYTVTNPITASQQFFRLWR